MCGFQLTLSLNLFRNRPLDSDLNIIRINNIKLPRVQSTKFLGIVINEKPHILVVKDKLSKTYSILYKPSNFVLLPFTCLPCTIRFLCRTCVTAMKYGAMPMLLILNVLIFNKKEQLDYVVV